MSKIGDAVIKAEEEGKDIDEALDKAMETINSGETKVKIADKKDTDITENTKEEEKKDKEEYEYTEGRDVDYTTGRKNAHSSPLGFAAQSDPSAMYESFRKFVNSAKLAVSMQNGKKYLLAEAWLYLAHLNYITPACTTTEVFDGKKLVSVKTHCNLIDDRGVVISSSDMIASKNEAFLKNLDDYAVYGMSQTRAITRAIRNVYGYVARGAGFESTPAIEMGLEKVKE